MAPSNSKSSKGKGSSSKSGAGGKSGSGGRSASAGVSKPSKPKGPSKAQQVKEKNILAMFKKPKKKTYTDAELGIPTLNMITPVGVVKPKGKKKGKIFVDDKVCSTLNLASPRIIWLFFFCSVYTDLFV